MNSKELKKLYERGEISRDVYEVMKQSNRKARYFTYDLKAERIIIEGERITIKPSREDSLDRLIDAGQEFATHESMEDSVMKLLLLEELHAVIESLPPGERLLIEEIYFSRGGDGKTVRDAAESLGIPFTTLNDRKKRILAKIKNLLDL